MSGKIVVGDKYGGHRQYLLGIFTKQNLKNLLCGGIKYGGIVQNSPYFPPFNNPRQGT